MTKDVQTEIVANPLSSASAAANFVQSYWQRRPAVIRQALSEQQCREAPSARELLRLVQSDTAETRLISRSGSRWQMSQGPLPAKAVPTLQTANWTVLVQGVDLLLDSARQILDQFRFLPDARLDDLMISIAGDGGGVGPHVDDYDVFLVQLAGDRRWQLAPPGDWSMREDQPLKLIRNFKATQTEKLSAGDMLYLPAGWAHNGVAQGPCTTASIGFRAPRRSEMQAAWLDHAGQELENNAARPDPLYRDPSGSYNNTTKAARWQREPARIPPEMMDGLTHWLKQWRSSDTSMRAFIGCHLSEPKPHVWFDRLTAHEHRAALRNAAKYGIVLDRQTRMLWYRGVVFINGESHRASALLKHLANRRKLTPKESQQLQKSTPDTLSDWLEQGWMHANNP